MPGSHPSIVLFSAAALFSALAPKPASASTAPSTQHVPSLAKARTCAKAAIEVVAGSETATFPLTKCDGSAVPSSVDQLSILGRPGTAPRPTEPIDALEKIRGAEIAPGVRRFDSRLVERLQLVVDHFAKDGRATKIVLVSGYRPKNSGTYHSAGRALDFRIDGVKDDAVVAFCKTLPDTGCGYYPNNVFVHMDVREPGTGHVSWVDTSLPESTARPVATDPVKDLAKDKREASENAKSDGSAKRDGSVKSDSSDRGDKPAATSTETPGLLLARPLDKGDDKKNDDKPGAAAKDDKPGAAAKDDRLPALPADASHRAKHKHKTRKARESRRARDDQNARDEQRFL